MDTSFNFYFRKRNCVILKVPWDQLNSIWHVESLKPILCHSKPIKNISHLDSFVISWWSRVRKLSVLLLTAYILYVIFINSTWHLLVFSSIYFQNKEYKNNINQMSKKKGKKLRRQSNLMQFFCGVLSLVKAHYNLTI